MVRAAAGDVVIGHRWLRLVDPGVIACSVSTVIAPHPSTHVPRLVRGSDARECVGEGRFVRVVGERVQKRVDGAIGVTEDGAELEQVDLVDGKRKRIGDDEDDVDL